jgi:hypothetical protein
MTFLREGIVGRCVVLTFGFWVGGTVLRSQPAIVLSAMGKTTNNLLAAGEQVRSRTLVRRFYFAYLCAGVL